MDFINASFQDAVFENGYMWVFDNLIQAICKIDTDNFQMEIISGYQGREKFLAHKIVLFEEKFYLLSRISTNVLIYDRKKEGKDSAFFLQESQVEDRAIKYVAFFLYNNCIYFFPHNINKEILCFNIISRKFLKKSGLGVYFKGKGTKTDLFMRSCNFYEGVMWFVIGAAGSYGTYNITNGEVKIFQSEHTKAIFGGVCFDGEDVWLIKENSNEVICEGKKTIQLIEEQSHSEIHLVREGIIVTPFMSDIVMFIPKNTSAVSLFKLPLIEKEKEKVINHYYCSNEDFVYLLPLSTGPIFVFDTKTLELKRVKIKCKNYIERCLKDRKILVKEDEDIHFENFLQFCECASKLKNEQEKNEIEMGKIIWETVQ